MEHQCLGSLRTNMQGRRVSKAGLGPSTTATVIPGYPGWGSILRNLVVAAAFAAAGFLGLPQNSFANSGTLDRTFGIKGKVLVALDFEGKRKYFYGHRVYADLDPIGRIVVLSSGFHYSFVVRFLPNGKRDRAFANNGVLKIDPQVDGGQFEAKDLEVDELGRVLVAGRGFVAGAASSAIIMRFDWRGRPDPSFGKGTGVVGVVAADLGLTPPSGPVYSPTPVVASTVSVSSLSVDNLGRILVAGDAGRSEGYCATVTVGFVARLTGAGQFDESFGAQGVSKPIDSRAGSSSVAIQAVDRNGGLLSVGGVTGCRGSGAQGPFLFRLNDGGSLDGTFGYGGYAYDKVFGQSGVTPTLEATQDRFGRIVALQSDSSVLRLSFSGILDRGFADQGRFHLSYPSSTNWTDLDTAGDGSVVIAGTKKRGPGTAGGQVALARISPRGRAYPRFGRHGVVTVGHKRTTNLTGRQVLLDGKGHVIVAGSVRDATLPTGEGLALFRFDL